MVEISHTISASFTFFLLIFPGLGASVRAMDLVMFTQVAEITGCLYLSSAAAVRGEKIRSLGITNIINITLEIPNLQLPNLESMQIQVDDSPTARLGFYFDRCADKIHEVSSPELRLSNPFGTKMQNRRGKNRLQCCAVGEKRWRLREGERVSVC